jgi:negative regulator of sigma E activity
MKNDDELLDEVIRHIRSEPVPEMPSLIVGRHITKRQRWYWSTAAACALAASLAGFFYWHSQTSSMHQPRLPDVAQIPSQNAADSETVVGLVDLAQPLAQLEAALDLIDAEVAELRTQASLLDARRRADELMNRYALGSVGSNRH